MGVSAQSSSHPSDAANEKMNRFISSLMKRMTLDDMIGQLNLGAGADPQVLNNNLGIGESAEKGQVSACGGADANLQRLAVEKSPAGIPILFGLDVIHGYTTTFPIPLAQACSWNLELIKRGAQIAAKEATANGIEWTWSPMVDIARDPRWGRVAEGAGEDPYLGGLIAKAMVQGYQGDNLASDSTLLCCFKHFALYGAAEGGRDYNTVDMSALRMYNQYLPPYKAAVEAGAGSVMSSFNLVDGVPATANRHLLTDILRDEWGFKGFVVTDYESVKEMKAHGVSDGLKSASAMALRAGTDMDMVSGGFESTLAASLADGTVTSAEIDAACRRVLEAKYKLGLFDNPYKYCDTERPSHDIYNAAHRKEARDMAASTFVLLKNDAPTSVSVDGQTGTDAGLLPLERAGRIALIGPLADSRDNMVGTWSVAAATHKYISLRQAMEREMSGRGELIYARGCNLTADEALQKAAEFGRAIPRGDAKLLHDEAMQAASRADVIVCAMGECADMSGESSSRASLELPDVQRALLADLVATGKPVVLLHFSGRPTVMTWEQEHVTAIMNVWFGGSEAADAVCDVLFGDKVPSGRLTMTMPRSTGQLPIYYNHLNTGRPVREGATRYYKFQSNYLDVRNDALYPFGYGLTYTTFRYSEPRTDTDTLTAGGSLTMTVTVTNTGKRTATETVQLYIRDLVASVSRPVKELRGFERITLKPGESRDVAFRITEDMLKFYNARLEYVAEPGDFEIMTGPNSRDVKRRRITLMTDLR